MDIMNGAAGLYRSAPSSTKGKGGGDMMLKLEVKTRLPEEQVKQRLKVFFKDGNGLNITTEAPDCLTFEGGGGYVAATICREANETRVELETREWEEQVKQFARDVS
jgi:hypothetical protein